MIIWIIQTVLGSLLFIFVVHYLIEFFKSTLTVPKLKDLVSTKETKYEQLLSVLQNESNNSIDTSVISGTNINDLPEEDTALDMKNELKAFLRTHLE